MISLVVFFVKIYFTVPKVLAGHSPSASAPLLLPSEYVSLKNDSRVQLFGVT